MASQTDKLLADASAVVADDQAKPADRLVACEVLVQHGVVEPALPVLRTLVSHPELVGGARLLLHTAEYMKRRGLVNELTSPPGETETGKKAAIGDAAFWRNRDPERAAKDLLLIFTGQEKNFWISLDLLHRIIRNLAGQAVYLRDFADVFFLAGIDPYRSYQATLKSLERIVKQSAARKLYTLGISAGGFAALKYGLDLSADGVLAFSPPTDVHSWLKDAETAARFKEFSIADEALDLVPFYDQAKRRPDVTIVYGGANEFDERQASRLAHLPGVRLQPIPNLAMHGSVAHLLATGRFEGLVRELLTR